MWIKNLRILLFFSKSESNIRVVRVQLNDGERVVGIRYPEILIREVEKAMKEQQIWEKSHQTLMSQSQLSLSQSAILNGSLATGHMINHSQASQSTSDFFPNTQIPSSPISFTNLVGSQNNLTTTNSGSNDIDLSSDNQPTSVEDQNVTVSKSVTEDVTDVNPKTLAKALRPPVTIKNFFKPTSRNASSSGFKPTNQKGSSSDLKSANQNAGKSTPASEVTDYIPDTGNSETEEKCKTVKNGDSSGSKKIKKEMSYSEFLELQKGGDADKEKTDDVERDSVNEKDTKHAKQETGTNSDIVVLDESSNDASPEKLPCANRTERSPSIQQSVSKKRKLEEKSVNQPAKKAKQVTLKSSFAKMETKSVTCPICNKVFEKGISNADLNQHIDNCIIE